MFLIDNDPEIVKSIKEEKQNIKTDTNVNKLKSSNDKNMKTIKPNTLNSFLKGATPAQVAQIDMICRVFNLMDTNNDGLISASDIKSYFNSIGRPATDAIVRKWIRDRDIDQDGAISLEEYVASYAYQLDPTSKHPWKNNDNSNTVLDSYISNIALAFGTMRLTCSPFELMESISAAAMYVQRIIDSPTTKEYWKISIEDSDYQKKIGHILGGSKLMIALGFDFEDNGKIIALKNQGVPWESVPIDVRQTLSRGINELNFHKNSLLEPTISNIAAGKFNFLD